MKRKRWMSSSGMRESRDVQNNKGSGSNGTRDI